MSAEAIEADPAHRSIPHHLLDYFDRTGRELQIFDDVLDQIYFNYFGEGFQFLLRHSEELNEVITYGDFTVELLTAVAIAGEERLFNFGEETETFRNVNAFVFLSMQDGSGEIDFSDFLDGTLRLAPWANSHILFYDEETSTAYFVVEVYNSMRKRDSISIDFKINTIFSDKRHFSEIIELDLVELLENHEATTTTEDSGMFSHMFWRQEAKELLDERFAEHFHRRRIVDNETSIETLVRDELSISLCQDRYISNIAIIQGLLHLQINEGIIGGGFWPVSGTWPVERSSSLSLIDTRSGDHIRDISTLFLEERDEEFNMVSDRRYKEWIYHFPDADTLNYLAISIVGDYFNTFIPLNISASFDLPIVEILGELYRIDSTLYITGNGLVS